MRKILLIFAMLTLLALSFNQASANAKVSESEEPKTDNSCEADSGGCDTKTY